MNLAAKTLSIFFGFFFLVLVFPTTTINAHIASEETTTPLRFIIYYDGDFENMLQKDSKLMSFLEAYDLVVINTFEIDKNHKGLTVEDRKGYIIDPQDLAKEISMYDAVLAVEVIQKSPEKLEL